MFLLIITHKRVVRAGADGDDGGGGRENKCNCMNIWVILYNFKVIPNGINSSKLKRDLFNSNDSFQHITKIYNGQ